MDTQEKNEFQSYMIGDYRVEFWEDIGKFALISIQSGQYWTDHDVTRIEKMAKHLTKTKRARVVIEAPTLNLILGSVH